jgi:hypothetical protein
MARTSAQSGISAVAADSPGTPTNGERKRHFKVLAYGTTGDVSTPGLSAITLIFEPRRGKVFSAAALAELGDFLGTPTEPCPDLGEHYRTAMAVELSRLLGLIEPAGPSELLFVVNGQPTPIEIEYRSPLRVLGERALKQTGNDQFGSLDKWYAQSGLGSRLDWGRPLPRWVSQPVHVLLERWA